MWSLLYPSPVWHGWEVLPSSTGVPPAGGNLSSGSGSRSRVDSIKYDFITSAYLGGAQRSPSGSAKSCGVPSG